MVYGIVNIRTKKRVRLPSGKLSDVYKYPYEAQKVIENVLGNSPYITVKRLEENKVDPVKNIIGNYDDEVGEQVRKSKKGGLADSTEKIVKNIVWGVNNEKWKL